jgi:hypothetical protein
VGSTVYCTAHHCIVRSKADERFFILFVEHIRKAGYPGWFYRKPITCFEEDGIVYWTMGNPIDETTIVNRARKEDSYEYRLRNNTLPGVV